MESRAIHWATKPMLVGTQTLVAGYSTLHDQEAHFTAIALQKQPEIVAVWYRYLTLIDHAVRGEHICEAPIPSSEHDSWELRLRLLGTATASAKLCLDASLAGYYSQAYGLIRHMLETWRILVYARAVPEAAINWFPRNGVRPQEPDPRTVERGIRRRGGAQDKGNLPVVLKYIAECNAGAHPSSLALAQVETEKRGVSQLGANYVEHLLGSVMSLGTLSLVILVDEISKVVIVNEEWYEELDSIKKARSLWHVQLFSNH